MTNDHDHQESVTAIVLLRSASGEEITGETPITAETLARYAPAPEDVVYVVDCFRTAGFDVGPPGGPTLAVTGPPGLFEGFFAVPVTPAPEGGWVVGESGRRELPLATLAPDLAARLSAVTFEEPAETVGP